MWKDYKYSDEIMGSYTVINWTGEHPEPEIIRCLIDSIGYFSLDKYRDIRVNRKDLKRLEKRVNTFVEKYLKTNLRVKIPLIDKDDDDIGWCEARIDRKIDFDLIKNE